MVNRLLFNYLWLFNFIVWSDSKLGHEDLQWVTSLNQTWVALENFIIVFALKWSSCLRNRQNRGYALLIELYNNFFRTWLLLLCLLILFFCCVDFSIILLNILCFVFYFWSWRQLAGFFDPVGFLFLPFFLGLSFLFGCFDLLFVLDFISGFLCHYNNFIFYPSLKIEFLNFWGFGCF